MMKYQSEKRAWNNDDTALTVGAGSLGLGSAYALSHKLNDFNPFGEKTVKVVGGVKRWHPRLRREAEQYLKDIAEGKTPKSSRFMNEALAKRIFGLDSFSGQSLAAADALQDAGFKASLLRRAINDPMRTVEFNGEKIKAFDPSRYYHSLDIKPSQLHGADAILQVGDGVNESALSSARRSGSKIYRMLSDYGDGNFRQPDYWLGQNWMKVRDPKFYDRLFVPGGAEKDLWTQLGKGRKANVNIGDIAVSPLFKNTNFEKLTDSPKAMLTIGGGSQGRMSLQNYGAKGNRALKFTGKDRTLFDDILAALKSKHGDNVQLNAYLGTAIQSKKPFLGADGKPLVDRKTGKLLMQYEPSDIQISEGLKRLQDALDPNSEYSKKLSRSSLGQKVLARLRERYKGLNIIGRVPQGDIAKAYATSDYVFALPGSTSAEYSAIKGQRHGGMIHLIPSEEEWAPRHFRGNAKYVNRIMQPTAKKNIVDLTAKNRLNQLTDAVSEGGFKDWGRKALSKGKPLDPMIRAIKKDIALKRLGRVGKLGLILTPAALAGEHFVKRHAKDKKDESILKRLKQYIA